MSPDVKDSDGRNSRWDDHRETRRAELVAAAVAAIDEHGPTASIAQIAAAAGVSKPVLYRYFADKDDLYRAVGVWGANAVLEGLWAELASDGAPRKRVERCVEVFLALISQHPHVFLLLVDHPTNADPLADGKEIVAAALARALGDGLREIGVDTAGVEAWAHGLVGLGLSTGEWWLRRNTMSRRAVSGYLTTFIWSALEGLAQENGVRIDSRGRLRLVETRRKS